MKRCVLFFLFLSFLNVQAQHQESYKPTLSELSGNGPSIDNRGYVYNFKGDKLENCYSSETGYNTVYNQFSNANYTYKLDASNGIFQLLLNGKQTKSDVLFNHFTAHNCFNVERLTGHINLSNEADRAIEMRVKSDVAIEQFGAYLMVQEKNSVLSLTNSEEAVSESLPAGKWKVIRLTAASTTWDDVTLDLSKVLGLGFYARNASDPQPKGMVEIDYVRVGSSARSFTASAEPTASGQGYVFSFDGDAGHSCKSPVNTTGNPDFKLGLDETQKAGVLTQKITGKRYEIFALEFTDKDCFLQHIELANEAQYYIEIKIKPDVAIPSFGATVSGNLIKGNLWDHGKMTKFFELKANEWNVIKVPVSMNSQTDGLLNPKSITGVVLAFNPEDLNEKLKEGTVSYLIDYIQVGDALTFSKK